MTQVCLPVMFETFAGFKKSHHPKLHIFNLKTDFHWHFIFILYPKEVGLDPNSSTACAALP